MPEMATLDAFFNKIEPPVSLSTAEQQKCKTSDNCVENHKIVSRKRGRDSDASAQTRRLQRKKQKPLDSNLNVSKCPIEVDVAPDDVAPDVAYNCKSCSEVEVQDEDISPVPSSAIEISYEEFLRATGIAHVETSLGSSEDADDVETEVNVSPVKTPLEHSGLPCDSSAKSLKKSEQLHDDGACEEDIPEVASKDIRSFFGKAEKVVQPVSAATLMKVKADVHSQQSEKRNVSSKHAQDHMKTGSDLARKQRAAIVITDDDLDIEVIHLSDNDNDSQIDALDDIPIDDVVPESCTENRMPDAAHEHSSSACRKVFVNTDDGKKSAVEQNSLTSDKIKAVERCAETGRELKLIIPKLDEASYKAQLPTLEEAVSDSEEVNCDQDAAQYQKEACSDESDDVIIFEEKDTKAGCDELSATEPSPSDLPDSHSDVPCTRKSKKPAQVRHFILYLGVQFCMNFLAVSR